MRKIKDNLLELKQKDGVTPRYSDDDDPKLLEDMFFYYNEFFREGKFPEFKATGGRVGKKFGGGMDMGRRKTNIEKIQMIWKQTDKSNVLKNLDISNLQINNFIRLKIGE